MRDGSEGTGDNKQQRVVIRNQSELKFDAVELNSQVVQYFPRVSGDVPKK